MTVTVTIQARDFNVSPKLQEYVEKKVGKLDHYLPAVFSRNGFPAHAQADRPAVRRGVAGVQHQVE